MRIRTLIMAIALLSASALHAEPLAIVVHPSNMAELSGDDLSRLYLGRSRTFPNGDSAIPINLAEGMPARERFDERALSRSSAQLKAYWSKLVFTGKGTPPQEAESHEEVLKLVATNPSIIGYLPASQADDRVRVVMQLD
ncbi:phosphate ABC transporter substrate-binding protein [Alkalimonas delamerensis]|uniref:Phosphate ABC transporter substrate-binding protein n=1 Tax=Alkalimonas delamerensis TaxID=265981 RepID=A0ABT9GLS1_9GAMM|nr:phosphate ABC transporter substrate-binding protein [Alkalimonas delamerensis]MDP4527914.1 phosphate ABC transporter substrate-binding protein [Alkalimonas delamerensis]